MATETAGARLATELAAFVRARKALFFIESREEDRVSRASVESLAAAGYRVLFWDVVRGAVELDGSPATLGQEKLDPKATRQPPQILQLIDRERERAVEAARRHEGQVGPVPGLERVVWVLRDYEPYLKDPAIRRHLRNLAETLTAECWS